jgi:hypothetical protein
MYLYSYVYLVAEGIAPPSPTKECPDKLATTCNLQCPNGNYVLDTKGCPTCACAAEKSIDQQPKECPLYKCVADCGTDGYKWDENGCRTCECVTKDVKPKPKECSRVICRMLCTHGFQRDENGCEICKCNSSPQPCPQLTCDNQCSSGYRKDYSGKIIFKTKKVYSKLFF